MIALHHVALAVPNVDEAVRPLAELGLPIGEATDFAAEDTREIYVNVAPTRILLIQPRSDTGPIARHIARRGAGFHHLGFETTDADAILESLSAWYACPSTFRSRAKDGPAWFIRPDAGLLVELQPSEVIGGLDGPDAFRHVVIDVPDLDLGRRLLRAIGAENDPAMVLRGGAGGVHHVELEVAGRRLQLAGTGQVTQADGA